MANSKARIAANARYNAKNYKKIQAYVKPDEYDIIDYYCKNNNISKAKLIVDACKYYIDNNIELDNEFFNLFKALPNDEKSKLVAYARNISEQYKKTSTVKIRCSEYKVSAGVGFTLGDSDIWNIIEVPDTQIARQADFALIVKGDSMQPVYHDGDIVLVKKADEIDKGSIGIFRINGDGFIKKLGENRLISLNAVYDDILFADHSLDEIKCIGLVLGRV